MHFRYHKHSLKLLAIVAVVGLAAHGVLLYINNTHTPVTSVAMMPEADPNEGVVIPTDVITLTTESNGSLSSYQYDLENQSVAPVIPGLPLAHVIVGDTLGVGLIQNNEQSGVGWIDFAADQYTFFSLPTYATERDIVGSSLKNAIAYSATNDDTSDTWYELANWDVVIHIPEQDYTKVISEAAHPQWLVADETLLYVKTDGVYLYDRTADTETQLISDYTGLTFYDDIAASFYDLDEGGATLALTLPSLGLVNTYYFIDETTLTPIARYKQESNIYTDPVVHESGSHIAVLEQSGDAPELVIFSGGSGQPVQTTALPAELRGTVLLDGWFNNVPTLGLAE